MKSLRLKFFLLYFISVFLLVVILVGSFEYMRSRSNNRVADSLMESGWGYINGKTPWDFEAELLQKGEEYPGKAIDDMFGPLTAAKVIASYQKGFGTGKDYHGFRSLLRPRNEIITWGVLNSMALNGPLAEPGILLYDTYSLELSQSEVGPVLMMDIYFRNTINDLRNFEFIHNFYYAPVEGNPDIIYVVSLDNRFMPGEAWLRAAWSDVLGLTPVVLICALALGWIISRSTVSPIKRIALAAENMSEHNLSQRVKVESRDEVGRLAVAFNNMAGRLEKAFASQKQFVSDAAHELRTPLASMKTAVSLALSKHGDEIKSEELLLKLSSRLETMERLSAELLTQAKADEKSLAGDQVTDIGNVVSEAADIFAPLFKDKRVDFDVQIGEKLLVRGESKSYLCLLNNLLDNARNTPRGGSVRVEALKDAGNVYMRVTDTGRGIAAENLEKIFERFYRVPGSENEERGFGLGLSICRSIAIKYGGRIRAESRVGEGSTFIVELPGISPKG